MSKRSYSARKCRTRAIVVAAGVGLWPAPAAVGQVNVPPGYYIQQLTDNPWQEDYARINNSGQIVFSRRSGPGNTGELILWEKATGEFTQLTNDNVADAFPDIADDGTITWTRFMGPPDPFGPTGEIMVRRPDGTIGQLTDDDTTDWAPRINNLGHVVWDKEVGPGCGGFVSDVFFYDGAAIRRITDDAVPSDVVNQSVAMNDLDQIVWAKFNFCVNPWESEVWMWDKGIATRLTTTQTAPNQPDINNRGVVVWFTRPQVNWVIDIWELGVTSVLLLRPVNR